MNLPVYVTMGRGILSLDLGLGLSSREKGNPDLPVSLGSGMPPPRAQGPVTDNLKKKQHDFPICHPDSDAPSAQGLVLNR